jgi:hypothetical protein
LNRCYYAGRNAPALNNNLELYSSSNPIVQEQVLQQENSAMDTSDNRNSVSREIIIVPDAAGSAEKTLVRLNEFRCDQRPRI